MLQQVTNLLQNGRLAEARTLCKQISKSNKKNPEVFIMLGDINNQLGDLKKAENNYQKAIQLKPDYPLAHTRLAMSFHAQGQFKRAETSYKQSLKLNPNQPANCFNLGSVLQEQGRLDEAVSSYRKAIELRPDYAKAYANLAFILRKQKSLDESEQNYQMALQYAADIPDIHYNFAVTLLDNNKPDQAEEHARKSIQLNTNYADGWSALGAIQLHKNQTEEACVSYQNALNINAQHVDSLCGYANALSEQGQNEKAMDLLDKALLIDPANSDIYISKGLIYLSQGKPDETLKSCDFILKNDPKNITANVLTASAYEKKGEPQKALDYLEPFLDIDEPRADIAITYVSIGKATNRLDDAIDYAEKLFEQDDKIMSSDRYLLNFALGKAYDSKKEYDKAFENYTLGNELKNDIFDISDFKSKITSLINVFDKDFKNKLLSSSFETEQPVFIVGMPRSGTSLVEQIIASHPEVYGAGELEEISILAQSIAPAVGSNDHYSECLSKLSQKNIDNLAKTYINHITSLSQDALRITDKMPSNYIHLGLIELMFPNARIIHCMRDPLDICLSCYFQNFYHSHPYSYNLANLGQVYNEYQRVMDHWKQVISLPIYHVQYETLVNNQESISRELIDFCGLDWDDNCLDFHKSNRLIWTASYDQVRQPMYTKSVKRWKNYEKHIDTLVQTLNSNPYNINNKC